MAHVERRGEQIFVWFDETPLVFAMAEEEAKQLAFDLEDLVGE